MRRICHALLAAVFAAGIFPVRAMADGKPLEARLDVETRLPVYLNQKEAALIFVRHDGREPLPVEVSFEEQGTGRAPSPRAIVNLAGPDKTHEHRIDISGWPDGQYKVFIREADKAGNSVGEPLVRALIKQTLTPPQPPQGIIDMRGIRMLFVDDWHLAQTSGLARRVCQPEMIPIEPWKTNKKLDFPRNNLSTFFFDVDGALNVRINASRKAGGKSTSYWARSRDLKTWEVIKTPAQQHPSCSVTNLAAQSMNAPPLEPDAICRRYDPARDGTPDIKEVCLYFTGAKHGEFDWAGVKVPGRSVIAVWEKSPRLRLILGDPVTQLGRDKQGSPAPGDIGDWTKTNDNFGKPRLSADNSTLQFWQTRRVPRHAPFRVHYDNLLSDRILITWSSRDGLVWTPTIFSPPTLEDPWGAQHYDMCTWWEEDRRLEFAYYQIFDCQLQRIATELACSRDGITWRRVEPGAPFLRNGPAGSWNFGFSRQTGNRRRMVYDDYYYEHMQGVNVPHFMFLLAVYRDRAERSKITVSTYESRFDGRMAGEHGLQHSPIMKWYGSWDNIVAATRNERSTPGLMRYRKDRWVALSATEQAGTVVTKPFRAPAHALTINAATHDGGQIRVELLDADGRPIPGYSGDDAAVFTGDETGAPLRWSGGKKDRLPGSPFVLSLRLQNAGLYALEFLDPSLTAP